MSCKRLQSPAHAHFAMHACQRSRNGGLLSSKPSGGLCRGVGVTALASR